MSTSMHDAHRKSNEKGIHVNERKRIARTDNRGNKAYEG